MSLHSQRCPKINRVCRNAEKNDGFAFSKWIKSSSVDLQKAGLGNGGSFYWTVRIRKPDGTFLDCQGKPNSFSYVPDTTGASTSSASSSSASSSSSSSASSSTSSTAQQCVPGVLPYDPPDHSSPSWNAVFRWQSFYTLQPGEMYDVLAWQGTNPPTSVGTTTELNLPVDFLKWGLGNDGSFYWTVRIRKPDGTFRDCSGYPSLITLSKDNAPNPPAPPILPQPPEPRGD